MNDATVQLVARWRWGDQQAASELFRRYAEKLAAFARNRLSDRMGGRIDPDDVVQSAYRSFFAGARDGRFDIQRGGDLWRLLVVITFHKLQHQVRRHKTGKRSVDRELTSGNENLDALLEQALTHEPSPLEAAALVDEVEEIMRRLKPFQSQVLERRLQGYTLEEIAQELQCSQRTIRRVLEHLKELLAEWHFIAAPEA